MQRRFALNMGTTAGIATWLERSPAFAVARACFGQAPTAGDGDGWSELDALIEQARREWPLPGASVAVIRGDAVVLAKGSGFRDSSESQRVTEQTLFALASTTKAFAALSIAIVDEGKINRDDKVVSYLPRFRVLDAYIKREMTIRDLLSHRTGVRDRKRFNRAAFSMLNRPNLANPSGILTASTFGTATQMLNRNMGGLNAVYQVGGSRSIQLALKIHF